MIQIDPRKFLRLKDNYITQDYDILNEIGKGGYGSVFMAMNKNSKEIRAVKKINKLALDDQSKHNLINEFEILGRLDHPNIIKLYDIYDDEQYFYVVTELCEGGNLLNFVNQNRITEKMMRDIMTQLINAVRYMHSFNILHRDIKLENIVLLKKVTNVNERIEIKLIDFGISVDLNKPLDPSQL
jgi:calcium-dependent protein kinase